MTSSSQPLIAAIEAGGTKFVCGIGHSPQELMEVHRIDTTTPDETIEQVSRWLSLAKTKHGTLAAIGIGSFGPIDLNPSSESWGSITSTPKPGWQHTDLATRLKNRFKVPVGFDTDVNAAVLGEHLWGAGQGMDPLIYITVGTGVGGGVFANGKLIHGALHPEIGHLHVPPPTNSLAIQKEGQCPYHKNCVEGYICGPALARRWGVRADALPLDHPAWEEVADVMGHALMNLCLTLSPKRIILGGGVMSQTHLIPLIRGKLATLLNGYLMIPQIHRELDQFVVSPGLGDMSGLMGAWALGRLALQNAPI